MKKLLFFSLALLLCLPLVVFAASIGGVETQGQGKFAIGMDQEFVFDKDYKDFTIGDTLAYDGEVSLPYSISPWVGEPFEEYQVVENGVLSGEINARLIGEVGSSKTEMNIDNMSRSLVKLSYGVLDHLDIFATLGEANFKTKIKAEASDSGTWSDIDNLDVGTGTYTGIVEDTGTLKGKSAFAWGLGAKYVYPFENGWFLGIQGQYLTHKNTVKGSITEKETGTFTGLEGLGEGLTKTFERPEVTYTTTGKATVQEWQIAPYIAKKLGNFIPYVGVKYSDQRINYKVEDLKLKIKAADNFGLFLGTDYKIGKNFSLNIEGRFIDETAMSLGATYRF